jgi:RNA polymerase sigma factor (sigma-70 family)
MSTCLDQAADDDNAAVLTAALNGDTAAWEEILRRYERTVRAAVACYRPTPADAADAVQNTWLRLFERASTIRDPERLGGWLATTARREYLALLRHQRSECPSATIDAERGATEPTPEALAILAETRRRVRRATEALPARPRALIDALYYLPCSSYADIARHTGMPIGSIGPTRLRTLRCLRRHITATDG